MVINEKYFLGKDFTMTYILDVIKGIMIGIANVIPGVSGGTMARCV